MRKQILIDNLKECATLLDYEIRLYTFSITERTLKRDLCEIKKSYSLKDEVQEIIKNLEEDKLVKASEQLKSKIEELPGKNFHFEEEHGIKARYHWIEYL